MINNIDKYSFHESTIIQFGETDGKFVISLEGVKYGEQRVNMCIEMNGFSKIEVDDITLKTSMSAEDGEVLTLEFNNGMISAIIEWNNFSTGDSFTHSYRIFGDRVDVQLF